MSIIKAHIKAIKYLNDQEEKVMDIPFNIRSVLIDAPFNDATEIRITGVIKDKKELKAWQDFLSEISIYDD